MGRPVPDIERTMLGWAREAAEIALDRFRHSGPLRFKYAREAITEADKEIEALLRRRIRERFPSDGVLGEELGAMEAGPQAPNGRVWHLDPIDGTLNFALGLPTFCTSIGLLEGDRIEAACVYAPLLGEGFTASAGAGAHREDGEPMQVSDRATLAEAVISAQLQKGGRYIQQPELLQAILLGTMKMRRLGTIALEMAYLADGRFDALIAGRGRPVQLYDVAAGILLVQEAGGRVSQHDGSPYRALATDLVATNGLCHEELMTLIRAHGGAP